MRVAVCDHDKKLFRRIRGLLKKYEEQQRIHVDIEPFSDEGLLWEVMKEQSFDLIFQNTLQGEHRTETGARVACIWLNEGCSQEIPGRPPEGACIGPIRKKQVFHLLDEIQKLHQSQNRQFSYIRERVMYQIPYSEILYFQSDGRKVEIYTVRSEKPKEYIGKLSELQKQGLPPNFITIHKSYIVNQEYIVRRSYEYVFLERCSLWLSVSQNHRRHVREVLEKCPIERVRDEEAEDEVLQKHFFAP